METKWPRFMKGLFSEEGLFLIKCRGEGDPWFSTYGTMIPIDVDGKYIEDNNYIFALDETLDSDVATVGSLKFMFFSEGLVCKSYHLNVR